MGNWLWVLTGILLCIIFILLFKLFMLKKTAEEIQSQFAEKLKTETNTLISISQSDKTMRKLAEDINVQLRKLREERQRFQRGDTELKTAVTNISHDLRTPLTAICGYMELMENEEKSESVSRYLERIGERIEMLKSLTEELFKYSIAAQMEEMQKEHVDLGRLLEESLVSFYGAIKQNNIEMEVSLAGEKVERTLDSKAVGRIFGNIINNAIKYSDGDLQVWMGNDGTVTFANTAKGLDAVVAARLFDRFYTVETGRNSTGLGLSIAKILTERMGGSIKAQYADDMLMITVCFPENPKDDLSG